jgi:hypothetical protein
MINLGFLTEGKLAAIFIKTFSWGLLTGRSFYFINSAHQVFWHHHYRAITPPIFTGTVYISMFRVSSLLPDHDRRGGLYIGVFRSG